MVIGIGTNVALCVHLSSTMNSRFDSQDRKMDTRFDSIERRLELIQGDMHNMDIRLTRLER